MRVRGGSGKWLMKRALGPYLPEAILHRRKMGFVTPISAWFRGPLADEARGLATAPALIETGWFDGAAIAEAGGGASQRVARSMAGCCGSW